MNRKRTAADFERENMVPAGWKPFNGKAIYNPSGKAGEYSYWACNFYNGCSNGCTYCYLKKGRGAKILGGNTPTLKKCFKDEDHALEVFEKELKRNLPELQKHGLFFSFTTDPMLPQTIKLTIGAMSECVNNNVPVKVLTKCAGWLLDDQEYPLAEYYEQRKIIRFFPNLIKPEFKPLIAFGFTITGHDELETGASTNAQRIEAMQQLHDCGFKVWASIEPIIDLDDSLNCIYRVEPVCDLFKIGLQSGKKYNRDALRQFIDDVTGKIALSPPNSKFYFKDSLLKQAGIKREDLPSNCVNRDYNIFINN
jgi:DNA repair photolyase